MTHVAQPSSGERPAPRIRGPYHDRHVLGRPAVEAMALPLGDDGVPVGMDPQSRPAVLGVFRRVPMEITLLAGSYLAQVLALRAVAAGGRIVIETGRPALWRALAQSADGGQQNVSVLPPGRVGSVGASIQSPVLVVRDLGARPPRTQLARGPWQATVTLLPYLDPRASALIAHADIVGLQRLSPAEAELAASYLGLTPPELGALPEFSDDLTLWCGRAGRRYVYLVPTAQERNLLGEPRRIDG